MFVLPLRWAVGSPPVDPEQTQQRLPNAPSDRIEEHLNQAFQVCGGVSYASRLLH